MRGPTRHRGGTLVLSAALGLSLLAGACGDDDSTVTPPASSGTPSSSPTSVVDAALAAKVPAAIKADGKIIVGTDSTYAPNEFLAEDGKTIQGWDVDLFKLVAAKLGLTAEFQTADFTPLIGNVQSGKYEIGVSSFTINPERKTAADMISYFSAGTQWATKAGNPANVSVDDACGKKVAVQKSTVQVDDLTARSKKCTDAGKAKITIDQYASQADATTAVVTGKDDAMLADSPIGAYAVKQTNGQLALLGEIYDAAPYGYVIKKGDTAFGEAIRDALKAIIADGSYTAALTKWGVEDGGITDPAINP